MPGKLMGYKAQRREELLSTTAFRNSRRVISVQFVIWLVTVLDLVFPPSNSRVQG